MTHIQNVRVLRRSYGETQKEFARRMGVSERTVRRWENNEVSKALPINETKLKQRENYRQYNPKGKRGYQVIYKDKKSGKLTFSKIMNFKSAKQMVKDFSKKQAKYKTPSLEFVGLRLVKLK